MAYKNSWVNNTPAHPCAVTVSSVAAGDLLLIYAQTDSNPATFTWPSGFTEIAAGNSTFNVGGFGVAYKVAAGSEGSLSVSNSLSNTMIVGVISYDSVDTGTPFDVTSVSGFSNTGALNQDLSITPVTDGATLVFLAGPDTGSGDYTFTFSTQSGTTGAWTKRIDAANGASDFFNVAVADSLQTTAGAVTARAAWDNSSGPMGVLVALRPVPAAPTINSQPSDTSANMGATANFSVTATASAGSLTYQWQSRQPGGTPADIGGATSSSYTTPALNADADNNLYRCKVTDSNGTTNSREARLRVNPNTPSAWLRA